MTSEGRGQDGISRSASVTPLEETVQHRHLQQTVKKQPLIVQTRQPTLLIVKENSDDGQLHEKPTANSSPEQRQQHVRSSSGNIFLAEARKTSAAAVAALENLQAAAVETFPTTSDILRTWKTEAKDRKAFLLKTVNIIGLFVVCVISSYTLCFLIYVIAIGLTQFCGGVLTASALNYGTAVEGNSGLCITPVLLFKAVLFFPVVQYLPFLYFGEVLGFRSFLEGHTKVIFAHAVISIFIHSFEDFLITKYLGTQTPKELWAILTQYATHYGFFVLFLVLFCLYSARKVDLTWARLYLLPLGEADGSTEKQAERKTSKHQKEQNSSKSKQTADEDEKGANMGRHRVSVRYIMLLLGEPPFLMILSSLLSEQWADFVDQLSRMAVGSEGSSWSRDLILVMGAPIAGLLINSINRFAGYRLQMVGYLTPTMGTSWYPAAFLVSMAMAMMQCLLTVSLGKRAGIMTIPSGLVNAVGILTISARDQGIASMMRNIPFRFALSMRNSTRSQDQTSVGRPTPRLDRSTQPELPLSSPTEGPGATYGGRKAGETAVQAFVDEEDPSSQVSYGDDEEERNRQQIVQQEQGASIRALASKKKRVSLTDKGINKVGPEPPIRETPAPVQLTDSPRPLPSSVPPTAVTAPFGKRPTQMGRRRVTPPSLHQVLGKIIPSRREDDEVWAIHSLASVIANYVSIGASHAIRLCARWMAYQENIQEASESAIPTTFDDFDVSSEILIALRMMVEQCSTQFLLDLAMMFILTGVLKVPVGRVWQRDKLRIVRSTAFLTMVVIIFSFTKFTGYLIILMQKQEAASISSSDGSST